jgi:hypothetical protein
VWSKLTTAIGGLAAVVGLIDLALYSTEKAKLKQWLEDWWLRFTYVNWSNFGRVEAETAVGILDRVAGARFWSLKKWRFVAIAVAAAYVVAVFCTTISLTWIFNTRSVME